MMNFLKNVNWDDAFQIAEQKPQVEELLVKKNNILARHDEPVYSQSLPTPANLKEDLHVELALMQEDGIITTIPHIKYFFAHF